MIELGMFMQALMIPERTLGDGVDQMVEEMVWLDELGWSEAWVGEHLTQAWEPFPAGDLIIAQGLLRTKHIKLCSGAYIPAFHHPAALALRIAQLDHMARGRYMLGLSPGSLLGDFNLIGVDPTADAHRTMYLEAIEIMRKMWTDHKAGEWELEGTTWTVRNVVPPPLTAHISPYTKPHPQIAITGVSPGSGSMKMAGQNGWLPLSVWFSDDLIRTHWEAYAQGAKEAGRIPTRDAWRVSKIVFVAESDEEARDHVRQSTVWRMFDEFGLAHIDQMGAIGLLKHDQGVPDTDVTNEYMLDHMWIVGSPSTVADKLIDCYNSLGGFGTLLATKWDFGTPDDPWAHQAIYRRHLELLSTEVMPKVNSSVDLSLLTA